MPHARPDLLQAALRLVELLIKETGEIQSQRVYMGDFPFMTEQGTFIINGAERVVVSQLVRSPGVYYTSCLTRPRAGLFNAKVIPNRGAWLEFETAARGQLYVKVDRKRKLEATKLLRAVGYDKNEEMSALFSRHRHRRDTLSLHPLSSATAPTPARKH